MIQLLQAVMIGLHVCGLFHVAHVIPCLCVIMDQSLLLSTVQQIKASLQVYFNHLFTTFAPPGNKNPKNIIKHVTTLNMIFSVTNSNCLAHL